MQDAAHFLLRHYHTLTHWPLQMYSSAVIFSPELSVVKRINLDKIPVYLRKVPSMEDTWASQIQTLAGHSNYVTTVAFSPDGKQIASGSRDHTIKLWNTVKGDLQMTLEGHSSGVVTVAFSPDGKQIASGSYDKTIRLWDINKPLKISKFLGYYLSSRLKLRSWKEVKTSEQVYSVEFSADKRYLATDAGPIMLNGVAAEEQDGGRDSLSGLFVRNQWICYGEVSFFRLPSYSRPVCHVVQGDQLAIGLENGRVLRFNIDRSCLQTMLGYSSGFKI